MRSLLSCDPNTVEFKDRTMRMASTKFSSTAKRITFKIRSTANLKYFDYVVTLFAWRSAVNAVLKQF